MPAERRTELELRRQIAAEREQLVDALADLRAGIVEKRRLAAVTGGAVVAGIATAAAFAVLRRFRNG